MRVDWPSKDVLLEMRSRMTLEEMATELGVNWKTVSSKLFRLGCRTRDGQSRIQWPSDDELRELSLTQTAAQIAEKLGCDRTSVIQRLARSGTPKKRPKKFRTFDVDSIVDKHLNQNVTAQKLAEEGNTTTARIREALQSRGLDVQKQAGQRSVFWRGGRVIYNGYVYAHAPSHPNARASGYVAEHRLVMEKKIGRYLRQQEVVHHIDENKQNNSPDNLELFSTNGAHLRATRKGKQCNYSPAGKLGRFLWTSENFLCEEAMSAATPAQVSQLEAIHTLLGTYLATKRGDSA